MNTLIYEHCPLAYLCCYSYVMQAWAFASGTRLVLGKSPLMNMENYPHDIWILHRKLFHRFLKYRKYFKKATSCLDEYKLLSQVKKDPEQKPQIPSAMKSTDNHVIVILSSSEGEVSEDSEDDVSAELDVDELFEPSDDDEDSKQNV